MEDFDTELIYGMIRHLPLLAACGVAMVLGVLQLRKHRLAAGLVLAGAALFAIGLGCFVYWEYVCIPNFEEQGAVPEAFDNLVLFGVPYLEAAGFALLVTAAFVGRSTHRRPMRFLDDD